MIPLRVEEAGSHSVGLVKHLFFDEAAGLILFFEPPRQRERFVVGAGQEELESSGRIADPPHGVEPGSQDKRDVASGHVGVSSGDRPQGQKPRDRAIGVDLGQAGFHQRAVFPQEGHHVGHRADGYQIDEAVRKGPRPGGCLGQRLRQLKRHPASRKMGRRIVRIEPGVDNGQKHLEALGGAGGGR